MKGVIFTEFLTFAEEAFGGDAIGRAVVEADLPSGGRYSAVGNYDHAELALLLEQLRASEGTAPGEVLRRFGTHLFHRFAALYPAFLTADSALELLGGIDDYVHAELHKLYPDAEFPRFDCSRVTPDSLQMVYRSRRRLADFAEGLILGCIAYFGEPLQLTREDLPEDDGQVVRFSLSRSSTLSSRVQPGSSVDRPD